MGTSVCGDGSRSHGSYILLVVKVVDIDSTEEVISLFEVELQKPRNLNPSESEECEDGEGVCVYPTLLWSDTQSDTLKLFIMNRKSES